MASAGSSWASPPITPLPGESQTPLPRAARAAKLMPDGGAMVTLTFGGSTRVMPNYNVMGVAKAALEASTRYLAADFGRDGIRVNSISAGPVRTLAGAGIGDSRAMFAFQQKHSPLGRGVTGETHFVDAGYNIISLPHPDALKDNSAAD